MALVVVEQDSYEEPALNLSTDQNNFLRCHIAEYDTRLFVFKTRQRLWHRICLLSGNTEQILSKGKLQKLLLENVTNCNLDIKVGFIYLKEDHGELKFEKRGTYKFVTDANHTAHGIVEWFKRNYGSISGLVDPNHERRRHLSNIVLACAMTLEISPSTCNYPSNSFFKFQPFSLTVETPAQPPSDDEGFGDEI